MSTISAHTALDTMCCYIASQMEEVVGLQIEQSDCRVNDVAGLRDGEFLQIEGIWHGDVCPSHPQEGTIQIVKCLTFRHREGGKL